MERKPVVAGQFYSDSPERLRQEVARYLSQETPPDGAGKMAMVPHAGYMFSGAVAGRTLARCAPGDTVLLLGPNHTGRGKPFAVWGDGQWSLPGGSLPVEEDLSARLLQGCPELEHDYAAHRYEHSLEVVLPFLWARNENTRIVPVSIAEPGLNALKRAGRNMAGVLQDWPRPVTVVVSSDMSHFVSAQQAKENDELAIQAILELDADKLYQVVREHGISMCGVLPMTVGLSLAVELGASSAELVQYATSGDVIGDYQQVVGYAGIVIA